MYSLVDASLNTLHTIKWNICSDEKMSLLEKLGLVQGAKVSVIASYFGNVIVSVNGKRIAIENRRKGEGLNSELPQARETPSGWRGEITNLMLERVCVPQSFNGFIGLE